MIQPKSNTKQSEKDLNSQMIGEEISLKDTVTLLTQSSIARRERILAEHRAEDRKMMEDGSADQCQAIDD